MAQRAGWPVQLLPRARPAKLPRWHGDLVSGVRWCLVSSLLSTAAFAQVDGGIDVASFLPDAGANCAPTGRVFSVSSIDANSNPVRSMWA